VGVLVVAAIIIGAVVVYPVIGSGSPARSTKYLVSSSTASGSSSSATSSSSGSASASSSSSATSSSSTSSATPFNFALISKPTQILITPGGNLTYPRVSVLSLPSAQPSGTEVVRLSVTTPTGISVRFYQKVLNISINAQMSLQGGADPPYSLLALAAAPNVAPGDYKVVVTGTSGSLTETNTFNVRVVQNLILVKDKAYSPSQLTVKAGSTVYWLSLGLPTGGDNAQEYDLAFKTINVASSVLYGDPIYDSFSYTFTTPGTYDYACVQSNDCPGTYMTGEIVVTA